MTDNNDDMKIETLAETENYVVWVSHEPDGETVYHMEMGAVTMHLYQEEWDETIELIAAAREASITPLSNQEASLTMNPLPRLTRLFIERMARHLPPSRAELRLLDIDGRTGAGWAAIRPDVLAIAMNAPEVIAASFTGEYDAVVLYATALTPELLAACLRALRPGGRLIAVDPYHDSDAEGAVLRERAGDLERAGYGRILVEPALENGTAAGTEARGILMRGEQAHTTDDTAARVREAERPLQASDEVEPGGRDDRRGENIIIPGIDEDMGTDDPSARVPGRFLFLLVRQTPHKPVWALQPGEVIRWEALCALMEDDISAALAFSSLPRAVAFLQPLVKSGVVRDAHKIAKFRRETAALWAFRVWANPPADLVTGKTLTLIEVDPKTAVTGEE